MGVTVCLIPGLLAVMLRCVVVGVGVFFFFKQKTAYEMRISDWSSDVCSSDLLTPKPPVGDGGESVVLDTLQIVAHITFQIWSLICAFPFVLSTANLVPPRPPKSLVCPRPCNATGAVAAFFPKMLTANGPAGT